MSQRCLVKEERSVIFSCFKFIYKEYSNENVVFAILNETSQFGRDSNRAVNCNNLRRRGG